MGFGETEAGTGEADDGMEVLSLRECEKLLRPGGVGVLALCGVEAPVLRPVNFVPHEGWLMIRTGFGQILEAAQASEPASFVISQTDALEHGGWSVIVTGRLVERRHILGAPYLPLRPWARSTKENFIGLSIDQISGRRIAPYGSAG